MPASTGSCSGLFGTVEILSSKPISKTSYGIVAQVRVLTLYLLFITDLTTRALSSDLKFESVL